MSDQLADSKRILIVESHVPTLANLSRSLTSRGHQVTPARTQNEALSEIQSQPNDRPFDIALMNVVIPGGSALDLLPALPTRFTQVILMSDEPDISGTLSRIEHRDLFFIPKPVDLERLLQLASRGRRRQSRVGQRPIHSSQELLGDDPGIVAVRGQLRKAAAEDQSVVITGESGSGCTTAAGVYLAAHPNDHHGCIDSSDRGVAYDTAIQAMSRTIFIDDVTVLPAADQDTIASLLKGRPDLTRVITVTGSVAEALRSERLRPSLGSEFGSVTVELPPLRRRRRDIPLLADHFAFSSGHGGGIESQAMAALSNYHWPGNVRQLRNEIALACTRSDGGTIQRQHLSSTVAPATAGETSFLSVPVGGRLDKAEQQLIQACLSAYRGDRRATASALGISLRTLYNRLSRYGWSERSAAQRS